MMKFRLGICFVAVCGLAWVGTAYDPEHWIAPEANAPQFHFTVDDAAQWQSGAEETPPVSLLPHGEFRWDGAMAWKYWKPFYGVVTSREHFAVPRGADGKVHLLWRYELERPEDDFLLRPFVEYYGADGKFQSRQELAPPDWLYFYSQPTAAGRPRRMDRSFTPPPDAVSIGFGWEFMGNQATLRQHELLLEPARPKPLRQRPEGSAGAMPPVAYVIDDARPEPDMPRLSDAEVTELLARRVWAAPEREKRGDRVVFTIDGVELPLAIHMSAFGGLNSSYFQNMAEAGFRIATINVKLGNYSDTPGAPHGLWRGKNQYDFEAVRQAIREVLRRTPDSWIIFYLTVNVYREWGDEHPGDVQTNRAGERAVSLGSRVVRYGGSAPSGGEFYEASNFSAQFRDDASEALRAFGAWLNEVPEGKVVIGAYLNGSCDGQWLYSDEAEFADYSAGALTAFRTWLGEKYATDAALSQAWGFPATLSGATAPDWEARRRQIGPDPNKGRSPLMEYNNERAQCSDWNAFLSDANTRRQIAFCEAFKAGSDNRLLAGMYWPTLPAAYPLSHNGFKAILEAPAVDFISRGGLLGATLHGKLTVGEFDLRNLQSGMDEWLDYDHPFHAKSQAEFRRQLLTGFCREFAAGGGFHLWDMWGGWFWHPETRSIIGEGMKLGNELHDVTELGENYIGVFVDDRAADRLGSLGRHWLTAAVQRTTELMGWGWASGWESVGVPVRFFVQEDALHPELTPPRVAIFLNPLTMTLEQGAAIRERFENSGRVVVYLTAPGLAAPGTPENPAQITGFSIHESPETINRPLIFDDTGDPLLDGIAPGSQLGVWTEDMQMPWYSNVAAAKDSPGTPLAHYAGSNLTGMLVERNGACTKVWIGIPGGLNAPLVRNLAHEAGLPTWVEPGSSLFYGSGLIGVAASPRGGAQTLRLPEGVTVGACLTGQEYQRDGDTVKFTLEPTDYYGDIAIFTIQNK